MLRLIRAFNRWRARQIGNRGEALLFFAFLDFVYSFSLAAPPPAVVGTPQFRFIAAVAPLPLWCAIWGVAGVVCFVYAFRYRDAVGFFAAVAIKVVWGTLYVFMAVTGVDQRAYVGAAIWLALARWVFLVSRWPEPVRWR